MAIELTPGEIYFVGEVDVRTAERSRYFKIGLVKEKDDERVDDRVREHQTGNPRQLTLLQSVKTPCVSKVENRLHRSFATQQVSGEWFHLAEEELATAISLCEQIAADASSRIRFAEASSILAKELSNGQSVPSSDELRDLHRRYLVAYCGDKLCTALGATVKGVLNDFHERGVDTSLYVQRQTKAGRKNFDEKMFQEKYPDIYAKFTVTQEKFKAGNFTVAEVRKASMAPSDIDPVFADLHGQVLRAVELARAGDMSIDEFYVSYLAVLEHEVRFSWEKDFLEAELKFNLGVNDEILDVCKWKREMTSETKFDKSSATKEHPELIAECTVEKEGDQATVLRKGRGAIEA